MWGRVLAGAASCTVKEKPGRQAAFLPPLLPELRLTLGTLVPETSSGSVRVEEGLDSYSGKLPTRGCPQCKGVLKDGGTEGP